MEVNLEALHEMIQKENTEHKKEIYDLKMQIDVLKLKLANEVTVSTLLLKKIDKIQHLIDQAYENNWTFYQLKYDIQDVIDDVMPTRGISPLLNIEESEE